MAELPDEEDQQDALMPEEEEETILDDPDVPLANLPQTGLQQILPFGVLGFGAAAMGAGRGS